MPRAERLKKCAVKRLKVSAKASGQTLLAAFLKRNENESNDQVRLDGVDGENDYTDEVLAGTSNSFLSLHESDESPESAPKDVADGSSAAFIHGDLWIKTGTEFTEHEKILSENKGRYCQANWFTEHEWMW